MDTKMDKTETKDQGVTLNQWIEHLSHWCPAQIFYHLKDNDGGNWLIYLRWDGQRGDEPWSAELQRCNEKWEHVPDSPAINLLEEKDHTPGIVKGYYYDEEYPFLEEKALETAMNYLSL